MARGFIVHPTYRVRGGIPVVQLIRVAKSALREEKARQSARERAAEAEARAAAQTPPAGERSSGAAA